MDFYLTLNSRPFTLESSEVRWSIKDFPEYKQNELESIDKFCMNFKREYLLKLYLQNMTVDEYHQGLRNNIPNFNNELNIRYRYKGAINTLSYGIPYKEDKKYFDYEYLRDKLLSLKGDYLFLQRLVANFDGAPIQNHNIALFHQTSISLKKHNKFPDEDKLHYSLNDFLKVHVLKYDKEIHDYATDEEGRIIYKWRQLHDLAMFVKNYDKQRNKSNESGNKPEVLARKSEEMKLSKKIVPGQLSMFDN